jgi:predicted ester cyclase/ketosteroid isomerase-like protein
MATLSKTEQNKMIMWRMIDEIWNQGRFEVADELFAPTHMSPSAPDLPPGSEGVKMLAQMFRAAMPDYRMTIDLMFADDCKVVGRFTQSGTHTGGDLMTMKASGRKATWTEIGVLEIENAQIVKSWYEVDMLAMIKQLSTPTTREVVDLYYKYANAGDWDSWCGLFAENYTMDEQLAGHIEGLPNLRSIMKGFTPDAYAKFQNVPKQIVVDGDRAAVVSHISALASKFRDRPIEAEVVNYFQVEDGKIKYMANFHDSRPFRPFLEQIGAAN